MGMLKKTLLAVAVLAATATLVDAEETAEKIDNPEYLNWKQFKAGATVTIEHISKAAGNETKIVTTTTLKELTDKKAVVSSQTMMSVAGKEVKQPAQDREIPATFDKPTIPEGEKKPDIETKEGTETLTVDGQEIACKWVKSTVKTDDNTSVTKVWNSDAVPGGLVKMESSTDGAMKVETKMMVTSFKTK